MSFTVRMGVPEVEALWKNLSDKKIHSAIGAEEDEFLSKWAKAIKFLSDNPKHPGLQSHEISILSKRVKIKVFQSYLENNTPGARRMFWTYGPGNGEITVLGVDKHPNPGDYKRTLLSSLPPVVSIMASSKKKGKEEKRALTNGKLSPWGILQKESASQLLSAATTLSRM